MYRLSMDVVFRIYVVTLLTLFWLETLLGNMHDMDFKKKMKKMCSLLNHLGGKL